MSISAIYKIESVTSGGVYIGSTNNITRRFREHRSALLKNKHINAHLQFAWNKYKEQDFKFEIIEACKVEELYEREQFWLDYFMRNSIATFYNLSPIAKGGSMSKAGRQRVSAALKGNLHTYGFKHSETAKAAISKGLRGLKRSPEAIENYRLAAYKREAAKRADPLDYVPPEWLTKYRSSV